MSTGANAAHFVVNTIKVSDLGTVGGSIAGARDVNDKNEIVGWSTTASGFEHAFLYSGGTMNDIGPSISPDESVATGINNASQIVGWGVQFSQQMGYSWTAGVATTLFGPVPNHPPNMTSAWKINDNGDICGAVYGPTADAITWQASGSTVVMPTASPYADAFDINLKSGMTGYGSGNLAWRWILSGGIVTQSKQVPWPAATGYSSGAGNAINDRGSVVGSFNFTSIGGTHAFFWDGKATKSVDLGLLPTGITAEAQDLDEDRFIAGFASEQFQATPVAYRQRAFLYHTDFGMLALPTLRGMLKSDSCRAYALNEWKSASSQLVIVGECDLRGNTRAVVWDAVVTLVP